MKELLWQMTLVALVLSTLLIFTRAQAEPAPIKASIYPMVALKNPYQRTTFRLRWMIEPHKDNRRFSIAFTCGAEVHSAQREINEKSARTTDRFAEVTVLDDCSFVACVVRVTDGKVKTFCDQAIVLVGD